MQVDTIPRVFVWTKFGTEAGETVPDIFRRKENERRAGRGLFLWGLGNNVGASIRLLPKDPTPEVLFSPIVSKPRPCDVSTQGVVEWTHAETLEGEAYKLPVGSLVTSRGGPRKRFHFALVCYSDHDITLLDSTAQIRASTLRNFASGNQVGSSQVTSVVARRGQSTDGRVYSVALRVELRAPYFVRLSHPVLFGDTCCPTSSVEAAIARAA
jgi:hypothetical protein